MDPKFAKLVQTLAPKLDELLAMVPRRHGNIPMTLPMKGVYLFSKGKKHLYVGRSNVLRKQFHRHFTHPRGASFDVVAHVHFGMTTVSSYTGHDRPAGKGGTLADPTECEKDLKAFTDCLDQTEAKSKVAAKTREAKLKPPKA